MKKTIATTCLALLLLPACQPNSFENEDQPIPADRVPLGIRTATASMTKALVTPGTQKTEGMKIGIFATGTDYFTEASATNDAATFTYTTDSWVAGDPNIFLTDKIATLYGFYPDNATLTKDATAPKIGVSIKETATEIGTITNNAAANSTVFNASTDEVDYMAFIPGADKGRLVNNGKANDGTPSENNTGLNPGSTLATLSLEHGMAMVSFRLYKDESYKGAADWTKFVLQNKTGGTTLSKGTTPTMSLADATITPGAAAAASITRTITSKAYTVPTDKTQANKVSCLVLPITTAFAAGDMQVVLTIDGTAYPAINIPAPETAKQWEKGKNYIYTLKLSGSALAITTVSVANWSDVDGGEIEVN